MHAIDLEAFTGLAQARRDSEVMLAALGRALGRRADDFLYIAAAGSLGRLELGPDSDFDSLFACEGDPESPAVSAAVATVLDIAASLGLRVPKPGGIFRRPATPDELLAPPALGRLDERPDLFGRRFQLLLDARPVVNAARFRAMQREVLAWYDLPTRRLPGERPWQYLLSDLLRYAHAYRNWQSFRLEPTAEDSWALRRAKAWLPRYVTFLGLYILVLEAPDLGLQTPEDWVPWLALTPLERIYAVMAPKAPALARDFLCVYEEGLMALQSTSVRAALIAVPAPSLTERSDTPLPAVLGALQDKATRLRGLFAEYLREADAGLASAAALPF